MTRKTTTTKNCAVCDKKMFHPFWKSKISQVCSRKCVGALLTSRATKPVQKECIVCSETFIVKSSTTGKFCSTKCYGVSMYLGKKPQCLDCNAILSAHGAKRCMTCAGINKKGENHPLYIVDRTTLAKRQERGDSAYREWRHQVWLRDNFTCKIVNHDCSGRIEAHHILTWKDYPESRYQINNGITLCHAHHPRKRAEEKRLASYFMELVSV